VSGEEIEESAPLELIALWEFFELSISLRAFLVVRI
jgi:hypothetical protein